MIIIFLSGGSGKRLWPMSNDIRSKQFLKLLSTETGCKESMVQRNVRQLKEAGIYARIIFATSQNQIDSIHAQFGDSVEVVTEPTRRDTFPAIALASAYLAKEKNADPNEPVIVMPCDQYTELRYFKTIQDMANCVVNNKAELVLMGVKPTEPASRYGYILPIAPNEFIVSKFVEKPEINLAKQLINDGALWNGGVFAFKLGWINNIVDKYIKADNFEDFRNRFEELPKISFDYEVAEKANSIGVCQFTGLWKDLGTWDALTEELQDKIIGKGILSSCKNVSIVNELDIPIVCLDTENLIIAASYDGILVSSKTKSGEIKNEVAQLTEKPRIEEKRWGVCKTLNVIEYRNGSKAITKLLNIDQGKSIPVNEDSISHTTWNILNGEGKLRIGEAIKYVKAGDVIHVEPNEIAILSTVSPFTVIAVQTNI